jgi:hypothetical protein
MLRSQPSVAFQESFITWPASPQFLKYVSLHATTDVFLLLSSKAFQDVIESIMVSIGRHAIMVNYYNGQLKVLVTRVASDNEDDIVQAKEEQMEEMISILNEFHTGVTK